MSRYLNKIPWESKPIGELLEAVIDYRGKTPPKAEGGIPALTAGNIKGGKVDLSSVSYVSEETYQRWITRGLIKPGDVLITTEAPVGEVALLPDDQTYLITRRLMALRSKPEKLDNKFLFYSLLFSGNRNRLLTSVRGSTVPRVLKPDILNLEIGIPLIQEQKAIAAVLSAFDDKIELNRQMNATLEEMARALFKSWFVDFDPVRRNQEARLFPKSLASAAPYDHLFPDELVLAGNGRELPKGWSSEPIGNHVNAVKGLSYKGKFLADEGIPMHNLNSVYEGGGYKYEGIKYYTGDYKERHIVKPGDVIVTNTEQGFYRFLIGYPAIVPEFFGDWGIYSHHIFRVRTKPKSALSNLFVYFILRNQMYHDLVSGYSNGTTVNMLPSDALEKPEILIPPQPIVDGFDKLVKPMLAQQEAAHAESHSLAALRDTLLPRLMSGQLRLPIGPEARLLRKEPEKPQDQKPGFLTKEPS